MQGKDKTTDAAASVVRILCDFDKTFAAFGAADADFAAASGNPDGLPAAGASVIAVLFVPQMVEKVDIGRVFTPSGLNVPGVHAENAPDQGNVAQQTAPGSPNEASAKDGAQQHKDDTDPQQMGVEFI